jgi:MSHA biogenesis protein MshN
MSVINRMLQDLDRRQALDSADAAVVRASTAKRPTREWFWRVLVVLLTAALAWMGWVAIQLLPRASLATDLAYLAAGEARARKEAEARKPAAAPVATASAPTVVLPATETPAPSAPAQQMVTAAAPQPSAQPAADTLRLATELQTPVTPRTEPAPVPAEPVKRAAEPAKPAPAPIKPKALAAAKPAPKTSVDKRDHARNASDNAEAHFRRAALLLSHGRVSEAEEQLLAALHADPRHTAARQAHVSLLLDQQRIAAARRSLQDALALDAAQPTFALALARIHAAERDYAGALAVLERSASVGQAADFQAFRGAMLQRLGRHPDAVEAYQNALGNGGVSATAWIGYGISLEALGRRGDAAQAYRRALASGPIATEAREYAESRARALE